MSQPKKRQPKQPKASQPEKSRVAPDVTERARSITKGTDPARIERIRQFALDLARLTVEPGAVMICNPISEPSALPAKELLYDRCRWCTTDIYYDRLMPSPPDITRVCLACAVLLADAQKKGAN